MAIYTQFRLRHANLNCYLSSHGTKLPNWGFEQEEVTCIRDGRAANLVWRVATHHHPTSKWSMQERERERERE
jgi:dolichyl-phosphate-mannose-protein mannosyltransferase